jgi:hypothetical protein
MRPANATTPQQNAVAHVSEERDDIEEPVAVPAPPLNDEQAAEGQEDAREAKDEQEDKPNETEDRKRSHNKEKKMKAGKRTRRGDSEATAEINTIPDDKDN